MSDDSDDDDDSEEASVVDNLIQHHNKSGQRLNPEDFSYVRLKQELEDSKVYFLNQLRRDLSHIDHSEEKKQLRGIDRKA